MKTLKLTTLLISILFIALAFIFKQSSKHNEAQDNLLNIINEQKSYTQTISKDIFYIYKNRSSDTKNLDITINKFLDNLRNKDLILEQVHSENILKQSELIIKLWQDFYKSVKEFKKLHGVASMYSDIILKDIVRDIYNKNISLVSKFDTLIKTQQIHYILESNRYKYTQYIIFILLVFFLYYLFVQIKDNLTFMQKFLSKSSKIISNSSIKDLEPINIDTSNEQTLQATKNFNSLVDTINKGIEHSSSSLLNSINSLNNLEKNIEQVFDLLSTMQESQDIDNEFSKKEDTVIDALEEIISSSMKLNNLKKSLDNLKK